MKCSFPKYKGFTLLELILVLAIGASVMVMLLNYTTQKADEIYRDRTTLQMQQILNAGIAFYIDNGRWPANANPISMSSELVSRGYLPRSPSSIRNAWGRELGYLSSSGGGANAPLFYVGTIPGSLALATRNSNIIAGRIPMGYTTSSSKWSTFSAGGADLESVTCTVGADCMVVGAVSIPGQNLNNARSVNFANIYHSGACVPVPTCPSGMSPSILVSPVQVNGVADNNNCSTTGGPSPSSCQRKAYPIVGYSAFATGTGTNGVLPPNCDGSTPAATCVAKFNSTGVPTTLTAGTNYYRVCLSVDTNIGDVTPTNPAWGNAMGSIMAITRCVPSSEPAGSDFTVWSK